MSGMSVSSGPPAAAQLSAIQQAGSSVNKEQLDAARKASAPPAEKLAPAGMPGSGFHAIA